jgi:hypothetical protein
MADYDFEILVEMKGKKYRMQVYRVYDGNSLERFNVVGGKRGIVLQSNRPMLLREGSRKAIDWKLLEGDLGNGPEKDVADALNKIIVEIEWKIKDEPPPIGEYLRGKKDE